MTKTFSFIILTLSTLLVTAQSTKIDSLTKLLLSTKSDTLKVNLLSKLASYERTYQKGLDLANEGLNLAQKVKYEKGEAACLGQIGNVYWSVSNYPMALHFYLENLKIRERIMDTQGMASAYGAIGYVYKEQGDYNTALSYFQKKMSLVNPNNISSLVFINQDFGEVYYLKKQVDSALKYYQRSYEYLTKTDDQYQFNFPLNGLGNVHLKMGNTDLALAFYKKAILNGIAFKDTLGLSISYINVAKLYYANGNLDSTINYAEKSLYYAQRANALQTTIESGKLLSTIYQNKNDKEALHFLQISQAANDSLNSRDKTMQFQNMTFNETLREKELADKKAKEVEERKQNIQYALIALGIIVFLTIFLFLSRTIIVDEKLISFFGVLGLLVVFEFVNLLIHPWLAEFTHESPVFMLIALVLIGALLIPLHHKLEHWIMGKMIEKNKTIRLAAAKKTIEKLEGQPGDTSRDSTNA